MYVILFLESKHREKGNQGLTENTNFWLYLDHFPT